LILFPFRFFRAINQSTPNLLDAPRIDSTPNDEENRQDKERTDNFPDSGHEWPFKAPAMIAVKHATQNKTTPTSNR
jgi:hypothetical protein